MTAKRPTDEIHKKALAEALSFDNHNAQCCLAEMLGIKCVTMRDCDECSHTVTDALARRLVPEGMEWPRFEDGSPVLFGDGVESKSGVAFEVEYVEFCRDHANLYTPSEGLFSVEHGERVKRPEPKDTQERIDEDAGKTPCEYFGWVGVACTKNGGCPARGMEINCNIVQTRDLLRRQRELDAKGAGR